MHNFCNRVLSAPCCAKLLLLVFVGNLQKYFLLSIPAFLRIGNVEYDAAHLTILIDILVSKCAVEISQIEILNALEIYNR